MDGPATFRREAYNTPPLGERGITIFKSDNLSFLTVRGSAEVNKYTHPKIFFCIWTLYIIATELCYYCQQCLPFLNWVNNFVFYHNSQQSAFYNLYSLWKKFNLHSIKEVLINFISWISECPWTFLGCPIAIIFSTFNKT